ncbi:MAG: MCE family protein [Proteobacteria bacterium]|nr:MCE family protein [Pseudomonadota bacterium]
MDFESNDVAVGALVLLVVMVFMGAVVVVNRARFTQRTYPLRVELREIAGIDKGADVLYRGYRAGQVDRVTVTYEPQFRFVVEFNVKNEIQLPIGSKVVVRGKGFTGGRFLDVIPVEGGKGIVLPENALLPVELEPDLMAKANDVLGEARSVVRRFAEKGTADDAVALIHEARGVVVEMRRTMANVNAMVEENRVALRSVTAKSDDLLTKRGPAIERSLKNIDEALVHVPAITAMAEELVADLKKHPWRLLRKGEADPPKLDHNHEKAAPKP